VLATLEFKISATVPTSVLAFMECNKEEAVRAKSLAERKMVEKDFVGAKKMILKAQQLSKELDNIPRMLAVCDVHSAAGAKVNGEIDWYGILEIPVNADDELIKKQYRRLAFLLHPDKNKFAGAEAAFKLVGEANMTLTDRSKRSVYDMKRNAFVRGGVARARPARPAPTRASGAPGNLNKVQQQQQHQASNSAGPQQTFWTMCPSCGMRYQYYLSILKKALCCQNCLKPFIAHDLKEQAVPSGANQRSAGMWKNAGAAKNVPPSQANVPGQPASNSSTPGVHVNIGSHHAHVNKKREDDGKAAERDKMKPARATKNPVKPSSTAGQKRARRAVVESSDSETASDSEEDIVEQGPAANSAGPGQQTRRSSRQRQEVKYNEESDEDDIEVDSSKDDDDDDEDENIATPSLKRSRKSGMLHGDHRNGTTKLNEDVSGHNCATNGVNDCSNAEVKNKDGAPSGEKISETQQMKTETMQAGENNDGKEKVFHSVSDNGIDQNNGDASADDKFDDTFVFVDPEFFDFDHLRHESEFRPNQIWAVYDDDGCMPRFYARITKVKTTPNFMVHYVWLEFDPQNKMEAEWHDKGLPVACGRFKHGKSETSKETGMFSRTISFDKSKTRNSYEIYPRKDEVWALFKGWNISWSLDADKHRKYQYEVVQVLSDLTTSTSIIVMPLVKIKGFVSLFVQSKEAAPYVISQGEMLRFSHCVPYHLMSGTEREGIPEGSLELDPAGLPYKFEESFPSVAPERRSAKSQGCGTTHAGSSSVKSPHKGSMSSGERQDTTCMQAKTPKEETDEHKTGTAGFTDVDMDTICNIEYVCAEPEFHKFSETRLLQKFSVGQIWSLYSDVDKFPNYYGLIHKVDLKNGKIQVRWLDACPLGQQEKRLLRKGRPIACGVFKVSNISELITYSYTDAFSHLVVARPTGRKGEYEIIPNLGEIWAVYKNWRTGWTAQDYEKCEYELVEIFGHTDSSTQVKILKKVDGYNAVFMPYKGGGSVKTIRKDEYLKFSHRIPCFHLTHEKAGKLRGCLELDPLSVPEEILIASLE
jgi:curved DNA-binding protein CbpA